MPAVTCVSRIEMGYPFRFVVEAVEFCRFETSGVCCDVSTKTTDGRDLTRQVFTRLGRKVQIRRDWTVLLVKY